MSSAKIDSAAVELAINAASDALANETDLVWIRKSCLIERAYFLGLIKGLPAIAEEDAVVKHAFRILMQTYWSRPADDTFPSTQLGRDFAALEKGLHGLETEKSLSQEAIETLNRDIDLVDRNWRNCVQRARSLLAETQAAASGFRPPTDNDGPDRKRAGEELGQIHGRISALGDMVRYMALLETHHEMSKRLEGA